MRRSAHTPRDTSSHNESESRGVRSHPCRTPHPIVLWRLSGALDDVCCLALETAHGYALLVELAGEPIWLQLQPSAEALINRADYLEAWLRARGFCPRD
jgi:hypothetical protein